MGQGIPSGEFPSCAGARSRFLRGRTEPRPGQNRRRVHHSPTAEVRAFVVSQDPPRAEEDDAHKERMQSLTEERDRALNALVEMEHHLRQLRGKVATTREERDWAQHNLRTLDEEVITLRAQVTDLADQVRLARSSPPPPLAPEQQAEQEEETEALGWDERSNLALELSRLQDDLNQMTEARDRALTARDALAQQALLASSARRQRGGFWAKNLVNLLVCLFLLAGMAMMGHFFPRIVTALSGQNQVPGGVEIRREPMEIRVHSPKEAGDG